MSNKVFVQVRLVLVIICATSYAQADPSIFIDGCSIVGKWDEYGSNVAQFRSIPYVQPPLNELRWAPPIRISNYSNTPNICNTNGKTINATYHHSRCWQPWSPSGSWPPQSENCVHLDIYSPSFNTSNLLPVMVYYHGGSSIFGGNFQYDFTNFSISQQMVVVVPNYRLALLGFLSFEALTQSSNTQPRSSGNYGLMDTQKALEWVKQYISRFGGDANDVTISGQSTGGTVVLSMLAMPAAKGLFKRAISMSGSVNISMDLATAEKQGQAIVDALNCSNSTNSAMVVSCMRSISAVNITSAYPQTWMDADDQNCGLPASKQGFGEVGLMIVDGYLVTQSVFEALQSGLVDVPLLIGNTQYEADFLPFVDVTNLTTEAQFAAFLNKQFIEWGPNFGENLWKRYYNEEYSLGGSQLTYDAISTDSTGFCGTKYLAEIAADSDKYQSNVYLYSFQQWPSHPFPARIGWNCSYSYHSIGFDAATFSWLAFQYWGTLHFEPEISDNGFGETIRDHWNHFVLDDKPLDIWKAYNSDNNYGVALVGNGPNKNTQYNVTKMVQNYKSDICKYYLDNGIGAAFWWSN